MQSNSLIKTMHQIETRLLKLARKQQYKEGLRIIRSFHKKYGPVDGILIQKAFFLYHYAAVLLYEKNIKKSRQNFLIQKNFRQAITICRQMIRKKQKNTDDKNILNARMYLAQIYAMLGQNKRAQRFAQQTFKYCPSALVAERVADVYFRTGNLANAVAFYKKAVQKGDNPTQKLMAQIGLAVTYKKMKRIAMATKHARVASIFLKQTNKNTNTALLGESLHAHFPSLDRA